MKATQMKPVKGITIGGSSIAVYAMLAVVFQGCQWKHDGKILKDKDGNLYILEASGIRNESYDLKPLPTADIDSLLNYR